MSTQAQAKVLSTKTLAGDEAKWIQLQKITWQDQEGKERIWEAAARSTRKQSGIDAVSILAVLETEPRSTIIIEQFRPPVGTTVIELPAGLIDDNESPRDAAFRELEEETGFKAETVLEETPTVVCDPGMTTANMKLFVLSVPVTTKDINSVEMPKQNLDQGEHIVRRVIALDDLDRVLKEYDQKGFSVDARLSHFASGYELVRKLRG